MAQNMTQKKPVLVQEFAGIMATSIQVTVAVSPAQKRAARRAIADCLIWLQEIETLCTRFRTESELSRLNAAAGAWFAVSDVLYTLVESSLAAAQASEGLFDPAILPLLEAAGYNRDFDEIAHREVDRERMSPHPHSSIQSTWQDIQLDLAAHRILLPAGMRLDLGGIVKGWAADIAADRFFADFPNVLISIGGDMRIRGEGIDGEPWAVGIGDSRQQSSIASSPHAAILSMRSGGLATSGATDRWWYQAGQRAHHIIDPRTGLPAKLWIAPGDDNGEQFPRIASATAFAPTAMQAEVAAKVALLRGYPAALDMVERAWKQPPGAIQHNYFGDARMSLLLILGSGEVVHSQHLSEYLSSIGGGGELWLCSTSSS